MIENLAVDPVSGNPNAFTIDLSWQLFQQVSPTHGVPPAPYPPPVIPLPGRVQNIYTLGVGSTYAWPSDIPLFARISPIQNPDGESVPVWVQPGGIGQSSPNVNSTVSPIPLPAQIDPSGVGGSSSNPLYVSTVATARVAETTIANPQRGNQLGYILAHSGHIQIFTATLVCGNETNERLLFLSIVFSPTGVLPFHYIIGPTTQTVTIVGGHGISHAALGTVLNFPLPDIFLPAGSRVGISVYGINPDDYLDDIDFAFTAT